MGCETCRADWLAQHDDPRGRAVSFDLTHPDCECEQVNVSERGPPVADGDLLARLIVSPNDWNAGESELIWVRIRAAWRAGLSFFRAGTPAEEVRERVRALTEDGPEVQTLVGALVTTAEDIRSLVTGDGHRTYSVYDTDADEFSGHADAIGQGSLIPAGATKSQIQKFTAPASRLLRTQLERKIVRGETADELIAALRAEGFVLADQ